MSTQKTSHPFIYGRPVRPSEFLSREPELRTIFNRIRNGESTAIEVHLRPFDQKTIEAFLDQAGQSFSLQDRIIICRVAGRYPFLLQAMAATFIEASGENPGGHFYQRISSHFDELWHILDHHTKAVTIILSLAELAVCQFVNLSICQWV